jgi:hypothetical protein
MQNVDHTNIKVCSKFSYPLSSELFPNLTQFRSISPRTGETFLYIYRSSHVDCMEIVYVTYALHRDCYTNAGIWCACKRNHTFYHCARFNHVSNVKNSGALESDQITSSLTLILLTWKIWWAPNNASKWKMGFNSVFKGLNKTLGDGEWVIESHQGCHCCDQLGMWVSPQPECEWGLRFHG